MSKARRLVCGNRITLKNLSSGSPAVVALLARHIDAFVGRVVRICMSRAKTLDAPLQSRLSVRFAYFEHQHRQARGAGRPQTLVVSAARA